MQMRSRAGGLTPIRSVGPSSQSAQCRLSNRTVQRVGATAGNPTVLPRHDASTSGSSLDSIDGQGSATASSPATPAGGAAPDATSSGRTLAQAAKVSAARELARRLSEERLALQAAAPGTVSDPEKKRLAEGASVVAARQAARADALARALRTAESSRLQLVKLQQENQQLKELLVEVAAGKAGAKARAEALASQIRSSVTQVLVDASAAPPAASQERAAPPPGPPPPPPKHAVLDALAMKAVAAGQPLFTFPATGVPVGVPNGNGQLFYNRTARGVLPAVPPGGCLKVKMGLNQWESSMLLDMRPAPTLPRGEWHALDIELPADVFAADFVVMGPGGTYDNNQAQDFKLELSGAPSQAEVLEKRAATYRAEEDRVRGMLDGEEQRLMAEVCQKARGAMEAGRVAHRKRRDAERRVEAEKAALARRPATLAALPASAGRPGVFQWCSKPRPGTRCLFAFNKAHGVLGKAPNARIHVGFDGWHNNVEQILDLAPLSPELHAAHSLPHGTWWGVHIDVPESAWLVDFVLSDREQRIWENNAGADFHTRVEGAHDAKALAAVLLEAMRRDGAAADAAAAERAAKQARRKIEAKGEAVIKRRHAVHKFLYTLPLAPAGGTTVEVHYNPDATMLRGRPDVFLRAGFSRLAAANGGTVRKLEPEMAGAGFWKTTLEVPGGATSIDLAFSDNEAFTVDGFLDDNGGLEYHIPVTGGPPRKGLKVVHVAVEMAPIAKVGGMGDVVTALGRAVAEEGHDVEVIIPKYDCINYKQVEGLHQEASFRHNNVEVRVWKGIVEDLPTTFLEPENAMFWVGCIYGRNDDASRFAFFCAIAQQYLKTYDVRPAIIHAHDWQSAPVTWGDTNGAKTIFTIHNFSYGADLVARAMASCNVATTVSPTYAREISGHASIAPHLPKLYGVLNGIDDDIWDPAVDPDLPLDYSSENVVEGKAAARKLLRERLHLSHVDVPVVGVVTRLVAQKGMHLIKHAAWRTLERGGQFVLLGSAPDPKVQAEFNKLRDDLSRQYPERAALVFQYDEPLSHLIYAGCDMFLVPSIFEPCGLTQMIAMRYGTVPVVRKTGGLADTVFDVDDDELRAKAAGGNLNGFVFEATDSAGLDYALNRSLTLFYTERDAWNALAASVMTQDWSWNSPALDYIELYYRALKG